MLRRLFLISPSGFKGAAGSKLEIRTGRALDGGDMIYEKDGCRTLTEAMAALGEGPGEMVRGKWLMGQKPSLSPVVVTALTRLGQVFLSYPPQ